MRDRVMENLRIGGLIIMANIMRLYGVWTVLSFWTRFFMKRLDFIVRLFETWSRSRFISVFYFKRTMGRGDEKRRHRHLNSCYLSYAY